jgi:xanthine dehydrogenase accessory factor
VSGSERNGDEFPPIEAFMRQSGAVLAHDVESQLSNIKAPTRITFGRYGLVTSTRFADRIRNGIKDSQLVVFEGCSHAPICEKVDEFNRRTLELLNGHTAYKDVEAEMSLDLLDQIYQLNRSGDSFAVATVVRVEKPISAKPGDKAIIKSDGSLQGWIGGGCAQDTVIREAVKVIREGEPRFLRLIGKGAAVSEKSEGVLEFPITCHSGGTLDIYLEPVLPRPQLIMLGNSQVAITLAKLGKVLNYEVDVFDPLATREEFPDADRISVDLDLRTIKIHPIAFVVVSTQGHDDEFALETAVRSGVPYIAFVASKRKFASRAEYLRERGISDEQIARIKAPAGLDIGAITPDEIAASILTEIIQVRRQQLAPQKVEAAQAVAAAEEMVVAESQDVICGMMVEIPTAKYVSEFRGEKYYFCCASCKAQFEKNPEQAIRGQ